MIHKIIPTLVLASITLYACKKEKNVEELSAIATSTTPITNNITQGVKGVVYSANGSIALGGVKVYVDNNGQVFYTKTNNEGEFQLQLPEGNHDLMITAGDGSKFRTILPIVVQKNMVNTINSSSSRLAGVGKLAYIQGDYDDIQTIITDSLGYSITQIQANDFGNLNYVNTFDAIFLNCGSQFESLDATEYGNLKQYLANGGSIYASDWAIGYLTGRTSSTVYLPTNTPNSHSTMHNPNHAERSCPTRFDGIVDNTQLCSDRIGSSGWLYGTQIVDLDLQTTLAKTQMDVEYDLGSWESILTLGNTFDVLIQDGNNGPLAVKSNANFLPYIGATSTGGGNNGGGNWVTICHIPPGNPNTPQTITISANALNAHLAHGDVLGSCEGDSKVTYTTFHNHPGGHTSTDVKKILEYFILNI